MSVSSARLGEYEGIVGDLAAEASYRRTAGHNGSRRVSAA